ncbi:MAG: rRNA ((1518)-N(6)/adenine(1519)-N(6))- dimethyltransferase RsmA [Nevskia sp.]|nr:rRNA ((1518)-N(6)/adenine(1519)-N(6))- dimethyltransferase RsmA [Nevskia sp.]
MNRDPTSAGGAHVARKRFGQHFLHDPYVIERILRALHAAPDDLLVEIGPGLGALTEPLLRQVKQLHVVEIDRDVIPHLRSVCGDDAKLEIHLADALEFNFGELASAGRALRLVGNLPYNISTPLLFHLLGFAPQVRDMHFMLQKEVVDRLTAAPGGKDYGRLTATVAARASADALFDVGPGAFRPPPKVVSSVVRITPRPAPFAISDLVVYDRLVTAAFSQRRKTLTNSLRGLLSAAAITECGIDPGARAEVLSPADFALLANRWIAQQNGSNTAPAE